MRIYKYKGKHIRASDKTLMYRVYTSTLLFLFIAIIFVLNMKQLIDIDWQMYLIKIVIGKLSIKKLGVYFSYEFYTPSFFW